MNKLIRNEWRKLLHWKSFYLLFILVLLMPVFTAGLMKYQDANTRTSWKQEYNKKMESYNRQLARAEEFDSLEWENELSWKADTATWQNEVQKYQFCIENNIPSWDWRMEVVEKYFRNLLLLNCIRDGWNPSDLSEYLGFDSNTDLNEIEVENQTMMVYCLNNDYSTYNKEQLMKAETSLVDLQEKAWIEDAQKTLEIAEHEVEKWENYLTYQAPPYAKDNWISLCIEELCKTRNLLTEYRLMTDEEIEGVFTTEEVFRNEVEKLEAVEAKDRFVLKYRTPTAELMSMAYVEKGSYLDYFTLIFRFLMILPLAGILLVALMIAGEYKQNTMKQLVMYPFKRHRILHAKLLTAELFVLVSGVLTFLIAGVIAVLQFRMNFQNLPVFATYQNQTIYWVWYPVYALIRFLFAILTSWIMISLTACFAVITRSRSFSILAGWGGFLGLPALIQTIYLQAGSPLLFKFVLFGNLEWNELLSNTVSAPYAVWWQTLASVLGWWILFRILGYTVFSKQDILDK